MLLSLALVACTGPADGPNPGTDSDPATSDSATSDSALVDTGPVDTDGDGVQDSLDCDPDDPDVGEAGTWYTDADGDGFGDPDGPLTDCVPPADAVDNADDCDDTSDLARPGGGAELCDGLDNDCNGEVDDSTEWATIPGTYDDLGAGIENWETDAVLCLQPGTHDPVSTLGGAEFTLIGADRDTTFISGNGSQHAVYNSGSVVTLESLTLVDGYPSVVNGGAAVFSDGGFLTVRDVVVDGIAGVPDSGTITGAAMQLLSEVDIDGLEIRDLDVDTAGDVQGLVSLWSGGGVVRNASLHDNNVAGDYVFGGILVLSTSAEIEDIELVRNTYAAGQSVSGVGLFVQSYADVTARRIRVLDNVVTGSGGGALVSSDHSTLTAENVVVAGLDSGSDGLGPMVLSWSDAELFVTNATLVGNRSGRGGVGFFGSDGSSQALFTNVIAAWNTAEEGTLWYGADDEAYVRSDYYLLHGNESTDGALNAGTFESGPWYGGNGTGDDPLFTDKSGDDGAGWDLTLSAASPAVDAGDPSILDRDGSVSDIGAYGGPGAWE